MRNAWTLSFKWKLGLAASSLVLVLEKQSHENPGFHWPASPASRWVPHSVKDPISKNKVESDWAKPLALTPSLHLYTCVPYHGHTHTPEEVELGTPELVSPLHEQKDPSLVYGLFHLPSHIVSIFRLCHKPREAEVTPAIIDLFPDRKDCVNIASCVETELSLSSTDQFPALMFLHYVQELLLQIKLMFYKERYNVYWVVN